MRFKMLYKYKKSGSILAALILVMVTVFYILNGLMQSNMFRFVIAYLVTAAAIAGVALILYRRSQSGKPPKTDS